MACHKSYRCPVIKNKELPDVLSKKRFKLREPLRPKEEVIDFIFTPYESLDLSLPECYDWRIDDILEWLRNVVKLPQYSEAFIVNRIEGEGLLYLNPSSLPRMNIRNFDHIKHICRHIRELFQIDYSVFSENISLPPPKVMRYLTLYLKNQTMLQKSNLTKEEFIKRFVYHYPESSDVDHCSWNVIDPSYYLKVPKTINRRTEPPEERTFIVNEEYKFDLLKKDKVIT